MNKKIRSTVVFSLLTAGVVLASVLPFAWFVSTSFKTQQQVTAIPPEVLPALSLEFYRSVFTQHHLFLYAGNSLIIAGATTIITLLLAVLAGYALGRLRMPGKNLIMGALLLVSMFPQISIAGPVWTLLQKLGLLNTYPGLILPYVTLTLPLGIWILTSFFKDLPAEIEDAARVDGCSRLQAIMRIILPLAAPGVFTAAILVFIYAWNEFFFALLIMTRQQYQTLPVGIALFQGRYTMPWGEIAAASTVTTVPLVALVFFCQKKIIRGLSAGAVKG